MSAPSERTSPPATPASPQETASGFDRGDLLERITQLHLRYIEEPDPGRFLDLLLSELLEVTGSEYGFIGEVFETPEGAPYLKTHAITNIAWNEETRAFYEANAPDGLEFNNLDTLFGHVLRTGEPLISNNPTSDPRSGGTPDGHPALRAFFGLPLIHREGMVGMVGMANRPSGYSAEFLEGFAPLWAVTTIMLKANISYRLKETAEQEKRVVLERLHQAERMETVGKLTGGIAHDMNNLLIAILGNTELACDGLDGGAEDLKLMREDLEQVLVAGKRAAALTKQLLTFSQRKVIQPRAIQLGTVVGELEGLLRRLIRESISLEFNVSASTPPVNADPSMMNQVLLNLALNARDAIDGVGVIHFEVVERPKGRVALVVTDDGRGMSAEEAARATEPFFTTKHISGTGLGLATVQRIVTLSGGHLEIDSTPGAGSTFSVLLPASAVSVEEAQAPPDKEVDGGTETLLVCEDDLVVLEFVRRTLETKGYRVLTAPTPHSARDLACREKHLDLLITDVVLPESGGPEVAINLQVQHPKLAVLFMSGYTSTELGSGLQEDITFLQKPFSKDELLTTVRQVLDQRVV